MNGKSMRQFVDTNVVLYAYDASAGVKYSRAIALIKELWDTGNGCLSIQVLQEFYVGITRKIPKPLDRMAAARIISDLGRWMIHSPGVEDVLEAIEIHCRHKISFWDALIIRSAAQLRCGVVWSEDLNPGQVYDGTQVMNPFTA